MLWREIGEVESFAFDDQPKGLFRIVLCDFSRIDHVYSSRVVGGQDLSGRSLLVIHHSLIDLYFFSDRGSRA